MQRYARQQQLSAITKEQEANIHKATIVCIGTGGVAGSMLQYLVGAGIKNLIIIDHDLVDITNLHRQILHSEAGYYDKSNKAMSAKHNLNMINSEVKIESIQEKLQLNNIENTLDKYLIDVLIDTTDNPETRFCVGQYCFLKKIKHIYAAAVKFNYQIISFNIIPNNPCFKCVFSKIPPEQLRMTAMSNGVAGPLVGVCGSLAATECFKLLCYQNDEELLLKHCLIGKMLFGDVLNNEQRVMRIAIRKTCQCLKCE